MRRVPLKSAFLVLLGVALGWGMGRLPELSGGTRVGKIQPPEIIAQNGLQSPAGGGLLANSKGVPGTGAAGEKSGRPRTEALLDMLRSKNGREGIGGAMNMMVAIAGMSVEEIRLVMELLTDKETDQELAMVLAARWGMLEPKAAFAFALDQPYMKVNEHLISSLIHELAVVDLPAAREALFRLGREERTDGGRIIVRMLQQKDPQAALAYARELKDSKAEAGALVALAGKDPMAAAAEVKPGMADFQTVVDAIASSLLKKDPQGFDTWVESLQDPAQRAVARSTALTRNAVTDPRNTALAAAAWLAKEPEASAHTGDLPVEIAQRWIWAKGPLAEVGAWAARLPEGPARDAAVRETGRLWLEQDMMAASDWLSSLPAGEGRDIAVTGLVRKISAETPADAFEWASTVESSHYRNEALYLTIQSWAKLDAAAAREAVQALPASDQAHLQPVILEAESKAKEGK